MQRIAVNRALAGLNPWTDGKPQLIVPDRSNPLLVQVRSSFDRNPLREAEAFVNQQSYLLTPAQRQQAIKYIERRFLQVSDQRIDGVLQFLKAALRDAAGSPLAGDALLKRLREIDPTDTNNAQALRNVGGAALSVLTQLAADTAALVGKMLIAPPPEVALGDPSAMTRYRQQSAALDDFFSGTGDRVAQFVGADPNSALYRDGKTAAELALLIGGTLKLAPGAIRLARMGKDVVLIFNDAKALQRAVDNPRLQKELAVLISNRDPAAIKTLPSSLQIKVRKLLKEWPDDPRAVAGLNNMPKTLPRTAIVNRISQGMQVTDEPATPTKLAQIKLEYLPHPNHGITACVRFKNGRYEMDFAVSSSSGLVQKYGGGADMFNAVMQRARQQGLRIDVVIGNWYDQRGTADNYDAFMRLKALGRSSEDAARLTPTGQLVGAYGYRKVQFVLNEPGHLTVHFSK